MEEEVNNALPVPDPYPNNRPDSAYQAHDWGYTYVAGADVPSEWHDGMVTLAFKQFDPRTAQRVGDTTETWSMTDLKLQQAELIKQYNLINAKIAYAQAAVDAQIEYEAQLAAEQQAAQLAEQQAAQLEATKG